MSFPKANYDYCSHDNIDEILSPPIDFYPIYSWGWRGIITKEGITRRLDDIASRGVRRLYVIPVTSEFLGASEEATPYLSGEYFEMMDHLVSESEQRGIKLWLYDEGGYPSGAANGETVKNHPHLAPFVVDKDKNRFPKESAAQPYPDLLKKESTEWFIRYTHERYKAHYKDSLARIFPVIFTDEPAVAGQGDMLAWTDGLEEKFLEKFGYDINGCFGLLFGEIENEEARRVRADYRDLISELFSENYFASIKSWCNANGMLSTGHVGGEDVAFGNAKWGYYHILRCLRAMDIPGVDMIWRQAFPHAPQKGVEPYAPLCANSLFPRYASSAAHQIGSRLALTESYAIYGAGLTYDQMRWVYNYQVVRGINILNPMNTSYSHAGKYGPTVGLPNFASPVPGNADLKDFNLWAARVSYVASCGAPISDSALYMPMRDIWAADGKARRIAEDFEATGKELEAKGCDIDIIDDDAIAASLIANGALVIGDAAYKTVYLSEGITVSDKTKRKLEQLKESGGSVITCSGDHSFAPIISDKDRHLRATRRKTRDGVLYYVYTEAFHPVKGTVTFPLESAKHATQIHMTTGEKTEVCVCPYRYDLALGEEIVLLFHKEEGQKPDERGAAPYKSTKRIERVRIQRLSSITIQKEGLVKTDHNDPPTEVPLQDLRSLFGDGFSGDVLYSFDLCFEGEIPKTALLSLGEVCYSAEVFLNGRSLGRRIFSPFDIPLDGLQRENRIEIRASNTMANAYSVAKYESWLENYKPGYMKLLQLEFEKDSLKSGIFGPIEIRW